MGSLGHYFMAQAAKSAEVVVITPFEYTSFIFLGIMGYFFYNEVPDAIGFCWNVVNCFEWHLYCISRTAKKEKYC